MNAQEELERIKANPNTPIGSSQYIEILELLVAKSSVKGALTTLTVLMRTDPDYRQAWENNLISAFKSVWSSGQTDFMNGVVEEASKQFIRVLCIIGEGNEKN